MAPAPLHSFRGFLLLGVMAACAVPSAAQLLSSEEKTLANGLRMVHVESTAFEEVALAMHWQFKPGLELAKTGTREAWAKCLDAQWRSVPCWSEP